MDIPDGVRINMKDDINFGVVMETRETDYIAGLNSPIPYEVRLSTGDWRPYLCTRERQSPPETSNCVGFSANHANDTTINAIINLAIATDKFSQATLDFFKKNGYLDFTGSFNSSDRFTGINAKTTKGGNSQQAVLDSIRRVGLIPESMLPFGGDTWEEYMNPTLITQEMLDLGQEFLKHVKINYEWIFMLGDGRDPIAKLKYHLKHAPVQVTIPICPSWWAQTPVIATCPLKTPQHAVLVPAVDNDGVPIFDQYDPYMKKLALDYPILYGLKIVVGSMPVVETIDPMIEQANYWRKFWANVYAWYKKQPLPYPDVLIGIVPKP